MGEERLCSVVTAWLFLRKKPYPLRVWCVWFLCCAARPERYGEDATPCSVVTTCA
jgi:hypothetical protein